MYQRLRGHIGYPASASSLKKRPPRFPQAAACPMMDLNTDNKIGLADILMFIPYFNRTCTP